MNNKELKSVIKEMVRQSLVEIFAEMKLESIVEGVMERSSSKVTRSRLSEVVSREEEAPARPQPRPPTRQKEQIRESLRKKLHISDSEWSNIYEGIALDNPIVTGQTAGNFNEESVSEEQLEEIGLMKDYSKFI